MIHSNPLPAAGPAPRRPAAHASPVAAAVLAVLAFALGPTFVGPGGAQAAPPPGAAAVGDGYGAAVDPTGARPLADLLAAVSAGSGAGQAPAAAVKAEGWVAAVCQNKGCWMELRPDPAAAAAAPDARLRITFRDYGYFVPTAIAGARVVVEGDLVRKEQSVRELRHLAEDAGRPASEIEAITEPKWTWSIVAAGVRVVGR